MICLNLIKAIGANEAILIIRFGKCINLNSKERKLLYDPDDIVHSTCSNEDVYKTWLNRVIKNIEILKFNSQSVLFTFWCELNNLLL